LSELYPATSRSSEAVAEEGKQPHTAIKMHASRNEMARDAHVCMRRLHSLLSL
jgi:hypothetical protein